MNGEEAHTHQRTDERKSGRGHSPRVTREYGDAETLRESCGLSPHDLHSVSLFFEERDTVAGARDAESERHRVWFVSSFPKKQRNSPVFAHYEQPLLFEETEEARDYLLYYHILNVQIEE